MTMGGMDEACLDIRLIDEADGRGLRQAYLRPNLPPESSVYLSPFPAVHAGGYVDGALVSVASFLQEDWDGGHTPGVWRLRGMVSAPSHRGAGLGGRVLEFGVAEIRRRGAVLVWCNGRTAALAFYRRHGFESQGDEFITPGTGPHYRLVRPLGT